MDQEGFPLLGYAAVSDCVQAVQEVLNKIQDIKDPKIKEELKIITQEAHEKEVFGTPTFVVNNKIFWGQDRLEFALEEYSK